MKIVFVSIVTVLLLGLTTSFHISTGHQALAGVENFDCQYNQCHAIAKSTGKRCKHCVSNSGDRFCWQHK